MAEVSLAPPVASAQDPAQWSIAQRQMDYVTFAKAMDIQILEVTKKTVQGDIQPKDAIATVKTIRGEAEASLAGLVAESGAGQQAIKGAALTPPETGFSTVLAQMASLSDTVAQLAALVKATKAA